MTLTLPLGFNIKSLDFNLKFLGNFKNICTRSLATLNTLKTMNDRKFELLTPRTLNATKFGVNDLKNTENYPQEMYSNL